MNSFFESHTKLSQSISQSINVKPKSIKLLGENKGENLFYLRINNVSKIEILKHGS